LVIAKKGEYIYNMKYLQKIFEGGVKLTTMICNSVKEVVRLIPITPDLWPNTNYQKHVPKSARQLMKSNWQNTGKNLRNAIEKVGKEHGSKK
jgi:hypothetical protein